MYVLIIDSTIATTLRDLPPRHWVTDTPTTGHFVPLDEANAASFGYLPVVDEPRPADTATTTWDRTVTIGAAEVTYGWTERDKTADELDADSRDAKAVRVGQAVDWLRARAVDAATHTATNGNHLATTNSILDNLAVFYDGFADLLEALRMDER